MENLRDITNQIIQQALNIDLSIYESSASKVNEYIYNLFEVIKKILNIDIDTSIDKKKLLKQYQTTTLFNPRLQYKPILAALINERSGISIIKDVILTIIQKEGLIVPNVENINNFSNLDDVIDEQEGVVKKQDRTGPIDLFTNSELIQDNITELNKLIEKINLELYHNLSSGYRFNENRVNDKYTTVEDLENDLKRLSGNDTKMISDKFDLIITDFKDGDPANHYETVRNYFKLGIYPLKKVNVKDQNKPSKNANLITGTQNIYKVENTQNPFKISPYVNNDLGDYVVNGKKINIKLVGLNYIVKEGTKTKVFKNLSYAKQFIYNGGFDMYNNNKSKFINNVSKDFNNKKQPLRLSYSSNIF